MSKADRRRHQQQVVGRWMRNQLRGHMAFGFIVGIVTGGAIMFVVERILNWR